MRVIFLLAGIAGLGMVGGCSTAYWSKGYGVEELTFSLDDDSNKLQNALTRKTNAAGITTGLVDADCMKAPVDAGREGACQQQRNAAIASLVKTSEDMCQLHLKSIYGNDAYYNIMTGTVATLFSGAAAIAGSASAKAALASISTFSNAERSLINETVYKNMLVTATSRKIRETRDTKAAALMSPATFGKTTAQYPLALAVNDIVRYHYSCSFMLGLEKALAEGTDSGVEAKKARLELEKRTLELNTDNRIAALTSAGRSAEVATDKGLLGAKARIAAIEAQLLVLVSLQAPHAAVDDIQQAAGSPPRSDAVALSKAYYALGSKLASARAALSDKVSKAKPADPAWTAVLNGKLATNIAAVDTALSGACKTTMDGLNAQIVALQGQASAAATGDARTRAGDKLDALLVQAGRFVARLDAQGNSVANATAALGKAIDDAKQAIDAGLKDKITTGLDDIAVMPGLCTL